MSYPSTAWMDSAACAEDPSWWLDRSTTNRQRRALCRSCPVLAECRNFAAALPAAPTGVTLGGLTYLDSGTPRC